MSHYRDKKNAHFCIRSCYCLWVQDIMLYEWYWMWYRYELLICMYMIYYVLGFHHWVCGSRLATKIFPRFFGIVLNPFAESNLQKQIQGWTDVVTLNSLSRCILHVVFHVVFTGGLSNVFVLWLKTRFVISLFPLCLLLGFANGL